MSNSRHTDHRPAPATAPPATKPPATAVPSRKAVLDRAAGRLATWSLRFLLVGAALVVVVWVLGQIWDVTLPVVLALLLSSVLWPPARLLRRAMPAAPAALLTMLAGLAALVGLGALIAPQVAGQWPQVADAVARGLGELRDLVSRPPFNVDSGQFSTAVDQLIHQIRANAESIAGGVLAGVSTAGAVLLTGVLTVVLCFFFLKDGPRFLPWLGDLVGARTAPHVTAIADRIWAALSGFVKAQAGVGLIDAVAIGIGLAVLDVPFALALAVLIFFGAFIPIVGAFITGALAALVALVTHGLTIAVIVVALIVVVQQLEGNVLQPMLVGRTLALHPAVVVLAVTAGGSLAGIIGMFLAVPVVAVTVAILRYGREQLQRPRTTPRRTVPLWR